MKKWRVIKVPIPNKFLLNCIHFTTNAGDPSASFARTVEKIARSYKLSSSQTAVGFVFIVDDVAEPTSENRYTRFIKRILSGIEHFQ